MSWQLPDPSFETLRDTLIENEEINKESDRKD